MLKLPFDPKDLAAVLGFALAVVAVGVIVKHLPIPASLKP